MNHFRADLHTHTTCSDGSLNPMELIERACDIGLNGLAITDHDTIQAYATALPFAKERGLQLISGVEFSAIYRDMSIHVLGYAFDLRSDALHKLCHKHIERRELRNRQIIELLAKFDMQLSMEEVKSHSQNGIIGRPHIAQAMMDKGYVSSQQQAFDDWIGEGKPCYARGQFFSVEETVQTIHDAKGLAVIAHPHLIKNKNVVKELMRMHFDGIECHYGDFNRDQNHVWVELAKQGGLLITAGSDFHGAIKPHVLLGCSWVGEELFNRLYAHFEKASK